MFFNLGMAADAAAAHGHEFSSNLLSEPSARPGMPSSLLKPSVPLATSRLTKSVMFEDAGEEGYDCDGFSPTSSLAGRSLLSRGRSAKCTQTSFQLAHPAPVSKHKILRLHTTLLLQLQQFSEASRPVPALDVLPSAVFAPRLAKKCSRVLHGRNGLGHNDLVIVTSQTYDGLSRSEAAGAGLDGNGTCDDREVVAAICPLKKEEGGDQGKAEIRLNYGSSWLASPLRNGVYEFVSTDECGVTMTARWVPRYCKGRRRATTGQDLYERSLSNEKTFGFSMVNPASRRHAIIATLNSHSINVRDQYPIQASISTTSQLSASSNADPVAMGHPSSDLPSSPDKNLVDTDEHLRTLIVVSGIWVAFREGYSQNFRYRDPFSSPRTSIDSNPTNRHRICPIISRDTSCSAVDVLDSKESQTNHKGSRTSAINLRRPTASTSTTPWPALNPTSSPRRANSTGTTFLQRASRRAADTASFPHPNVVVSTGDEKAEHPPRPRRACACVLITHSWQLPRPRKRQRRNDSWPGSSDLAPQSNRAKEESIESGSNPGAAGSKGHLPPANGRMKKSRMLDHLFCFIRKASGTS
ncbi:MAG: hypothetical protein LQ347_002499 [Umbilicaria vellea]|nr:MAG: hypothetical protein LQ347_002499 [Umbilicaria vellea]